MRDILASRLKVGVVVPSTNTVVQPDFDSLRPMGVTNHIGRIFTQDTQALSNESFMAGTHMIGQGVADAVTSVMTCAPDYMIMGMSAVTFYGGRDGASGFLTQIEKMAGVKATIGAFACEAALNAVGAKRVAFLSPYYPVANDEVRRFLKESGFEVVRDLCLKSPSWTAIARLAPDELIPALKTLFSDGRDVDAILQVGTNLSMMNLASAAELWLEKPVIAINAATYWHALRSNGINDKVVGFGTLLADH